MTVDQIIDGIIEREGDRYTHDPNDSGGATHFGITQRALSAYVGREATVLDVMRMTRETAHAIYLQRYYLSPGFDRIASLSSAVAEEVTDTGVNLGPTVAVMFLQRALNAFNLLSTKYPDAKVDGQCGPKTISNLRAFIDWRGAEGIEVLLKALNCLQGERYIDLAERRPKDENFVFGWLKNRVSIPVETRP